MARQTVLLIDDRIVFSGPAIRRLMERFDVLGAVADENSVVELAGALKPDAIVLGGSRTGLRGPDVMRRLLATGEERRILLLMAHEDRPLAAEALQAGARGIVLEPSSGQELVIAIDAVLAGHRFIPHAFTGDPLRPLWSTDCLALEAGQLA